MRLAMYACLLAAACGGSEPRPAPVPPPSTTPVPPAGPPVAERRVVTDTYHGVAVEDPYRWLEADDAAVKAWSGAQDRHARAVLDALPVLPAVREEVRAYLTAPVTRYNRLFPAGGKVFAYRKLPTKQQAEIVVMDSPEQAAAARLVLDPTAGGDKHRAIDWFEPSPDGTKVAVAISSGGSESASLHIVGLDGAELEPVIPNVQRATGGGDVAWRADSQGLWYTRYPAQDEASGAASDFWMQLWFHQLGTPLAADRHELGKDFPKIAEVDVDSDARGRALVTVANGDGGIFRHYLRDSSGWRALDSWDDEVVDASFGPGEDIWLVSVKGALRGRVLRLPARAKSLAEAKVVIPEGERAIERSGGVVVTRDRILVTYHLGGPLEVRAFTLDGKPAPTPALPAMASTYLGKRLGDDVLVYSASYTVPGSWYRLASTGKATRLEAVSYVPPVSLAGWEARRELATSKDGTKVPVSIVWRTGTPQDGSTPCVVTGYGGYGISSTPYFLGGWYSLLRRGACVVQVSTRGGGEFGEAWHRAGMLTAKQNVFDDFTAALDHLVAAGYTRPDRTAILGGSNGGLLMGAILTQHPEKVKAVVALVGIYDMLRVELTSNGEYNTTEFGTVKDEAQFRALHAYSPYHRVVAGTSYPAVLMTTGANDVRVAPWQSRKMIAALQAAQRGGAPLLLRTSDTSGHGMGTAMDDAIEESAHVDAFLLSQLGIAR